MGARKANLHVPLPEELHRRLREEASRSGQPATEIAREGISLLLEGRRRQAVAEALAAYARAVAGSRADLDTDLEAVSIEHLVEAEGEQMRRGDIFVAELRPRSGSEQRGTRPVIVVSHDAFNEVTEWRSIIVVPVSSSARQAARGPSAVPIEGGIGGLPRSSVALCHQVTTLDRSKLSRRLGTLPPEDSARVDAGLKAALSLIQSRHGFVLGQPVPLSHDHHTAALGIDCRYRHTAVRDLLVRRDPSDRHLRERPLANPLRERLDPRDLGVEGNPHAVARLVRPGSRRKRRDAASDAQIGAKALLEPSDVAENARASKLAPGRARLAATAGQGKTESGATLVPAGTMAPALTRPLRPGGRPRWVDPHPPHPRRPVEAPLQDLDAVAAVDAVDAEEADHRRSLPAAARSARVRPTHSSRLAHRLAGLLQTDST